MEIINSLDNKKVVLWSKLKERKYRNQYQMFIIEGEHLVSEAIKNNMALEIITTDETKKFDIPTYLISDKTMKKISSLEVPTNIIAVCKMLDEKDIKSKIILLDGIQNPGNLGTIIRSALAFNFDTVVLGNNTVDIYNDKVLRATEGMIFSLNILKKDTIEYLKYLKERNYLVIGTDVNNGTHVSSVKSDKLVLVMGNEGAGLSEQILAFCNEKVNIKINKKCESLNVGVAASILMYELGCKDE